MLSDTLIYGFIAQLAEHSAVNRRAVGSSPTVSVYKFLPIQLIWEYKLEIVGSNPAIGIHM